MALRNADSSSSSSGYSNSFPEPFSFSCLVVEKILWKKINNNSLGIDIGDAFFFFFCTDSSILYAERRSKLYDSMARDLDERGALFLKDGETSQSLSLSDIFAIKDGSVAPVLKVMCQ